MTYFRSRHHTSGLEPALSESLYGQPYFPTGYGPQRNSLRRMTRPDQDEYPFMTSDTYDHFDSHYFRDYQYNHGNQFTPQRSFHRPNQNQQPSQYRPQYSPYTNTGIDQEHDRSSTNLTSTDRILAMLRINREARLKLRDQSNQDDHRLGSAAQEHILEKLRIRQELRDQSNQDDPRLESAAQETAPQPSQEPETGTHTPAEPVPSEKAGAPSQDPQGLHSESVTNQVDCRDPEPIPDSELTIGTMASAPASAACRHKQHWYYHASHAHTASARTQPTIRTALAINRAHNNTHTPDGCRGTGDGHERDNQGEPRWSKPTTTRTISTTSTTSTTSINPGHESRVY